MGQITEPTLATPTEIIVTPPTPGFLTGYKTYIIAGGMIIYALLGWYLNQFGQTTALFFIFNALGFAGLRNGIASLTP